MLKPIKKSFAQITLVFSRDLLYVFLYVIPVVKTPDYADITDVKPYQLRMSVNNVYQADRNCPIFGDPGADNFVKQDGSKIR